MTGGGVPRERIEASQQGIVTVLKPKGRLCNDVRPGLEEKLREVTGQGCRRIVMDMSATSMVDSTGLSVLTYYARALKVKGGRLVLASPAGSFKRIVESCNLNRTLRICNTLPEAIEAARQTSNSGRLQKVQA